jgi:hypothetical protein
MPVSVKMVKAPDPELPLLRLRGVRAARRRRRQGRGRRPSFRAPRGRGGIAPRGDHRAGALGHRLQAQPDHGAAIRLARADRHAEERQDETRADDGEARSGAAGDPAPPRTARVLPTQWEAHLRQHAAKLDAASSSPRWAATDQRGPHPAPHLLLAPCDARRAGSGHSGAGRTRRPQHHDALHAPVPRVAQPSHPAARAAAAGADAIPCATAASVPSLERFHWSRARAARTRLALQCSADARPVSEGARGTPSLPSPLQRNPLAW